MRVEGKENASISSFCQREKKWKKLLGQFISQHIFRKRIFLIYLLAVSHESERKKEILCSREKMRCNYFLIYFFFATTTVLPLSGRCLEGRRRRRKERGRGWKFSPLMAVTSSLASSHYFCETSKVPRKKELNR